ncbi:LPXTG-motif cell wall anchor domain-containing protein [Streptococcus pneumoniae]|nr:LPXTG-motif cell wall anchor domain-containing protein [Streptococcus pneumoniae]
MKDIFNKRQRFSIRKFSVGVASVLIGIALFTPSQGVLASTENNLATEIGANSERENATSTVEKKQEAQNSPENQGAISSPSPKDTPIGSTRTTELETSGDKENNSLTTRASVAGEDRSSAPAVRAASNPSDIKKYELTEEDAKKIKAGVIGSEGNKLDSLLLNGPELSPEAYTDNDYLKDKEELYIYEKGGKKYVGYNSHPMLEDTDGDGIIDSKEKPDEKLKWNVSERDMIMFMELSYRDDNYIDRVLNHKKPLTESELYKNNGDSRPRYEYMMMNKELGPYWERKKSYHTSSGLDAVLYETKSDFSYLPNGTAQVLAFRGTSDAKDIGTDITLGLGSNPQQGIDAENIMRELAKDKSITNLYLTGHSLGGYLVQRVMVEAYQLAYSDSRVMSSKDQQAYRNFYNNVLKKGTTFNAPKVRTNYFSSSEFWQKGLDSKKIAKSGKMTHYIVDNDSTISKAVSNDSDVVINVGRTSGGHSSRSYFEADMINRRSEFISGKRISLDRTGYQDKKIATAKSVEKVGETVVYSKRGDDIIKSTTVSIKDPDTGQITKNTLNEVFKKDGAKSTVVVTSLEPIVRYEKDATRPKGEANVTTAGTSGARTVTTTYTVNPTDGSLVPHEEPAVVVSSKPTVVKVPAKDEVAYLKEGDDVVKKTTTYAVNASTGNLAPTEKKEIFKQNGAKAKSVVTPLQPSVRYERDATRAKGGKNVTTAGTSGTRTVTTTYTVNPADGSLIPHEGKPVIKQSTPTVVKVPAKDEVEYLKEGDNVVKKTTTYAVNASTGALTPTVRKDVANPKGAKSKVVVTPLKSSVRYEKDATRAKGEEKITVAGSSGTRTVTTTYTVNPADGSLIPHEGKPVIKSSTPTVVKVPAKDEVEYLKEGDDIVKKTTSYQVNASTGVLTSIEKKEVFKQDGAKSTVVVTPLEPSIRYEKDATRAKGEEKITVAGTPGTSIVTTTYTVNPTDGSLIPHEGKPVIKQSTPTVVKVPAKDEVEYLKDGDDVVKKTTTYEVNASTGALVPTEKKEVFKQDGTKSTVVVTPLEPSIRYEKDSTRAKGEANVTTAGTPGTRTVTTTYTVNPINGGLVPHEDQPVTIPSTPTVVKVPAKDEVEYLKEGDDVVKKTTTYEVNASTGDLTPIETTEIFKRNGAKSTVVVTPIKPSVRYEKDSTRAKGEANVTTDGTPGTSTVTTTYTVNPADGSLVPHEGQPVIKPSTPTVVKVPAKDEVEYLKDGDDVVKKTTTYQVDPNTGVLTPTETTEIFKQNSATSTVVVTPLEPSVSYEKDATRPKGEANVTVAGTPGTKTVTTTYTVNSTDGSLIPHEEPAVVVPAKPTVIKVPANDEVEYLKDGDEVVKKTTTYQVDPNTGVLTPTETTEIFKRNGAKSTVVVTPLEPSVRYEKDATRVKGEANVTVAGTPGTRTVTTTYTVNSTDGSLIPHEEPAVVVPAKPTVIKVPANDEVEYLKDGDEVVKKTTTYQVDPNTGVLTPTETTEIFKRNAAKSTVVVTPLEPNVRYEKDATRVKGEANVTVAGTPGTRTVTTTYTVNSTDGSLIPHEEPAVVVPAKPTVVKVPAKDKVVETSIEPEVEYVKDVEKDFGTPDQRTEGEKGKTITTTTYDVDPKDGHITAHVGNPVVTPAGKTVVKVGAKTKVEQSKDPEGRDVIDTTTYEVDPKTGKVTPTTVRTYGTSKEPTIETRSVPSPVVYEKDDSRDKDSEPVRREGTPGEETITTTYTVDSKTGKITPVVGQPVRTKEPTNTIVKVAAKDKVETTEIPSPKKYVKDDTRDKGQDNVEEAGQAGSRTTTTTYEVNPADGTITERVGEPVIVNPTATIVKVPAKDKVVETSIEPEVEYVKDVEKDFGTPDQRTEGEKGKTITATTYDVDPKDGHITEHVGNPVVTPAGKTIVKVGAKTKVERNKDDQGRDVIDTITYEVDPKTGKVISTIVRTYGTTKEPTTETRPVPSPVVYEKDDSRDKDSEPVRREGTPGEETITTTYTVDSKTGKITPVVGQPVRTKEPTNTIVKVAAKDKVETIEIPSPKKYVKDDTRDKGQDNVEEAGQAGSRTTTTTYEVNPADGTITERVGEPVVVNPTATIVKVPAKDKVVETPIEPEVEYVKDVEKGFGTPDERIEGEKGKTVTTTTYDVDPKDGHITAHVGNPVVTPAGKTVVKVGAKTKVEQSKDPEGRDVIDTTTYEVDPKTGKVTPTTVRTYGKAKEPKVEIEQDPKTGEVGKGKVPDSGLPDVEKPGIGKTTEPGKPSVEVPNVTTPPKVTVENGELPGSITLPELTIEVRWIDESGNGLKSSVKTGNEKDAEHGLIPGYEFVRTVISENEPLITHMFRKVSGSTTPNPATPPNVTIFENGVLPDSIELPELMIEVHWIDEAGNALKPTVKTGNEKDAEHGSISGYEFVRTVIAENEPVLTHIFRKVSSNTNTIPVTPDTNGNSSHDTSALTTPTPVAPVTPDTNGDSGQDTAVSPTPIPDAVTPNANHEDTTDFIDNRAKSNNSQTVLPNTGTESNATLASLGLLGMLGGLGLAFGKKKED